jgi:hypothetical protein
VLSNDPEHAGSRRPGWQPDQVGAALERRDTPLRVHLPRKVVTPAQVRVAAEALSGGTVTVADHRPEPSGPRFDDAGVPIAPGVYRPARRLRPRLAGPGGRVALYVVAVLFVLLNGPQPWNQPWWPGTDVATGMPDPCTVIEAGTARALVGAAPGRHTHTGDGAWECEFAEEPMTLRVAYYRFDDAIMGTNTEKAASFAASLMDEMPVTLRPLRDTGDEAWIAVDPDGTSVQHHWASAVVVARRANVVIGIGYRGTLDADTTRTLITEATRDAADALHVT